jgi:hypothetical protein
MTYLGYLASTDGSIVLYDQRTELCFVWNRHHTVNVWVFDTAASVNSPNFARNIDVFTVGDFANDRAREADVEQAIAEYIRAYIGND